MKTLKEKVIAVAGVSSETAKFGFRIFDSLVKEGYNVYGVNPKGGSLAGRAILKSLAEAPSVPDIVITAVKPEVTEKIVEECGRLGIKEIWMQPGSESPGAIDRARALGISVTAHSCIMVHNDIW